MYNPHPTCSMLVLSAGSQKGLRPPKIPQLENDIYVKMVFWNKEYEMDLSADYPDKLYITHLFSS
ncbi:hypothetical protein C0J52_03284 [Blattella germanica]|nr:hypothetical protein C0J52_03284 [Blattella germanica]